ncbi:Fc.00g035140.m01.CDS01 [Cosmosporella sp. VM-42]
MSLPFAGRGFRSQIRNWEVGRGRGCQRRHASLCAGVEDETYPPKLDKGTHGMCYLKRHVKCDETKPSCLNCMKWRGYCDGYTEISDTRSTRSETPAIANSKAKLIHTKKAPLILTEPALNTIHFANSEERAYFDEWSYLSVGFLSGGLGQSRLWTATMPQLTLQETTLRYGAMAVGALRKACNSEAEVDTPASDLMNNNKHYLNAIIYYCEALRLQAKAKPNKEGLRTAMLSSLLFICFEAQRGNMPAALKHVTHGFTMLNELAACTEKAPDLVSIAPAPPALVQEILECYKPLELQSRSFMGSYKKFFFPPKQQPPAAPHEPPRPPVPSPAGPTSQRPSSPPSQPGSPWQGTPTNHERTTGLPSPQSQDSPPSQADQQSPPRAPPRRPPGIAPFTKHSPYFRPKQSNITTLEEMPAVFRTFDEVAGYWALLQRNMVVYIPFLTATTAQLALIKVTDLKELEARLASVRQNPKIAKFVDESRHWLQRWVKAFDPMYQHACNNRHIDPQPYLQVLNFRIEYLILYIYTAVPRFSSLENARSLTPQYLELNRIAETLISTRPNCGFAMDSGWTWPLFVSSFGCRDSAVREDAIRILAQYPIRNALRDSRIYRAIALKNQEVELKTLEEGTEDEQWLRLRRRELVFEDLGTNIIFRSAQKNHATGEWELVEEIAAFMVGSDGKLDWHRQPISESASILGGVC